MKRSASIAFAFATFVAMATTSTAGVASVGASHSNGLGKTTSSAGYHEPLCESGTSLCADVADSPGDEYVGHDEPSVLFKSDVPGSGNDITYTVTLPRDPTARPSSSGSGSTWNFQLRPTFWFGLTLCDTESAPEFTKECVADSDANNLVGTDPTAADYIGKHPGNAFMELQFYGPGFVPQFEGFGCGATVYCAALTIDSLTQNSNTGAINNADCSNYILGGTEPINWAYITRSGVSQAPADPLFTGTFAHPNFAAVNPDFSKDLLMKPGDSIRIHMHDTAGGLHIDLDDLTSGQSGSMTAGPANGFAHVLVPPISKTCHSAPYAFHPEYSTGMPRGNTWSAHTYNVSFSDEIGHFENCLKLDSSFNCVNPGIFDGAKPDRDDGQSFCVPKEDSSLVKINGCFAGDGDWDNQSYRLDWPGTDPNVSADRALHPEPVRFTSPRTNNGTTQYSTMAFEADLPRLEIAGAQDNGPFCNRTTGDNCVNPPNGAQFYPFYSTTDQGGGGCLWQEGGNFIPGTTNNFGGSSTSEYGPLLNTAYPGPTGTPIFRINNFNSGDQHNPCPAG